MGTWRLLDHPADLAIEGSGATAEAAVESLLEGLMEQVLGCPRPTTGEEQVFEIQGLDRPECLVSVLNEVLYRVAVRGFQFHDFRLSELGEQRLRLKARGGPRPPGLGLEQEVKAATYHGLDLSCDHGGVWRLRVLFDV